MRNRELEAFLSLGKKKDGTYFTPEDIRSFNTSRQAHKTKFKSTVPGITYAQLVAQSTSIDIKRANNKVSDGTGIKAATFLGLKHNLALISVNASDESVHQHHRVRIRFEEWDKAVEEIAEDGAKKARIAADLCKGRVSFDCDCGRHQYWYRYMATAGNYAVAPPKEYAFPKIRNPDLTGVACKHVLHAMTRFQSPTWHKAIIIALEKATSIRAEMDDIFKQCGIHPNIVCTCPNMDSLISMVRADMGVTFLSSGVAKAYLTPDLSCLSICPVYRTQTAMITRNTAKPSEPLQYFEDYFYGITH